MVARCPAPAGCPSAGERSAIESRPPADSRWERSRMRRKITVIGAGNVGATAAQEIARRDYADVVLVDIIEGLPQGKALDMNEAGPVLGYEAKIVGTNGYAEAAGSDVVVVTSGKSRSTGMNRV